MKQLSFKGAIFDLDGVLVETVPLHFRAWKRMFTEYGRKFSFDDYKEKVDGIPRLDGARAILTDLTDEELQKAAARKQSYYLEEIKNQEIPIHQDAVDLINNLKKNAIKVAVISSSRNCPYILERTGIVKIIDIQISGNDITKGKPNPQIFLMASERLQLTPSECIVFEDAVLGVEAAKRAGMICVGIDRHNDPKRLEKADLVIKDLTGVDYRSLGVLFIKTHERLR